MYKDLKYNSNMRPCLIIKENHTLLSIVYSVSQLKIIDPLRKEDINLCRIYFKFNIDLINY